MTYTVSGGTLNLTHSCTHSLTHPIPSVDIAYNIIIITFSCNKKPSYRKSVSTVLLIFGYQCPTFSCEKKAIFRCGDAAISNTTINAKIRYGNSADVGDGCRQQL